MIWQTVRRVTVVAAAGLAAVTAMQTPARAAEPRISSRTSLSEAEPLPPLETDSLTGPHLESREADERDRASQRDSWATGGESNDPHQESHAIQNSSDQDPLDSRSRDLDPLLDDCFHQQCGVSAIYLYTGEVFNNARGGISTAGATKYRGDFDLVLALDTAASDWWEGGQVFAYFYNTHGRTLSREFVGDAQLYSNLDTSPLAADLTDVGELWYRQDIEDLGLAVKFGHQDANADFAYSDLAGDFINSSFATLPNVPLPTWPFQRLGVSMFFDPCEWLHLSVGTYDTGANQRQWWFTPVTNSGTFSIAQAELTSGIDEGGMLPTRVQVGAWYDSSDIALLSGTGEVSGNYGWYVAADRMLFAESSDETQGLGAFFEFSWAPGDVNGVDRYYGGGLTYSGWLRGRDQDLLGIGLARVSFSHELTEQDGMTYEAAIEAFYKAEITPWAAIQPDVQYIANPFGMRRDALVVGMRYMLLF